MDRFDFSPLFRSTIGFDRLTRLVDAATRVDSAAVAYPPYNIETTGEDAYRLTMAVAGFSPPELDITVQENTLLVTGKAQKEDANGGGYLHRGIARRAFERRFSLADRISAVYEIDDAITNAIPVLHISFGIRSFTEGSRYSQTSPLKNNPQITMSMNARLLLQGRA